MARQRRKPDEPPLAPFFDMCVHGQLVSPQAVGSRRLALEAWKQRIRTACLAAWPHIDTPLLEVVSLRVTYYCEMAIGDVDNLVKPIQDALQGVAHVNDRQISDVIGRRRSIDGSFRVRYMSPVLAMAFTDGRPFVHIEVWRRPDQEEIVG